MKINPADRQPSADGPTDATDTESEASAVESTPAEPLTIALPDGSESVSEAILSHRQMLTNPDDHGLVSASETKAVREAVDQLAEDVPDELAGELDELGASVETLTDRVDQQQRQIRELRATVTSLAEILGASVEFEAGDEA